MIMEKDKTKFEFSKQKALVISEIHLSCGTQ